VVALRKSVDILIADIQKYKGIIEQMSTKLEFVLSYFCISEQAIQSAQSTQATTQQSINTASNSTSQLGATQWSDVVQRKPKSFTESVVAAVYIDQTVKNRRASSIIVSGMQSLTGCTDSELITKMCLKEFNMRPDIAATKRIGSSQGGKIQPIFVQLKQVDQARLLIDSARLLRKSNDPDVAAAVYINPNLTRAEATAAYQLRQVRRQAAPRRRTDRASSQSQQLNKHGANYPCSATASVGQLCNIQTSTSSSSHSPYPPAVAVPSGNTQSALRSTAADFFLPAVSAVATGVLQASSTPSTASIQ
jgi:hypothetical protein